MSDAPTRRYREIEIASFEDATREINDLNNRHDELVERTLGDRHDPEAYKRSHAGRLDLLEQVAELFTKNRETINKYLGYAVASLITLLVGYLFTQLTGG